MRGPRCQDVVRLRADVGARRSEPGPAPDHVGFVLSMAADIVNRSLSLRKYFMLNMSLCAIRYTISTAVFVLVSLAALPANAQTSYSEGNKTILHLGVQGAAAYVQFVEGTSQQCNELYISDPATYKVFYAQLLAAALAKIKISRVDYTVTNGLCTITLLQVNP